LQEIGGRNGRGVPILLTGLIDREVHEISLRAGAICCINKNDLSPTLLETTFRYALFTHRLEADISMLLRLLARRDGDAQATAAIQTQLERRPWLARAW
jgi:hypothetical protein